VKASRRYWMGEDDIAKQTAARFVVRDSGGTKHLAYRGSSRVVGFTVCRIAIKFKGSGLDSKWRLMRMSQGAVTCMGCLAREDE